MKNLPTKGQQGFNPNLAFTYSSKNLPKFKTPQDDFRETVKLTHFKEPKSLPNIQEAFNLKQDEQPFAYITLELHHLHSKFTQLFETLVTSEIRHPSHNAQYLGLHEKFSSACYFALAKQIYSTCYQKNDTFIGLEFLNKLTFDLPLPAIEIIHQYGQIQSNYGSLNIYDPATTIKHAICYGLAIYQEFWKQAPISKPPTDDDPPKAEYVKYEFEGQFQHSFMDDLDDSDEHQPFILQLRKIYNRKTMQLQQTFFVIDDQAPNLLRYLLVQKYKKQNEQQAKKAYSITKFQSMKVKVANQAKELLTQINHGTKVQFTKDLNKAVKQIMTPILGSYTENIDETLRSRNIMRLHDCTEFENSIQGINIVKHPEIKFDTLVISKLLENFFYFYNQRVQPVVKRYFRTVHFEPSVSGTLGQISSNVSIPLSNRELVKSIVFDGGGQIHEINGFIGQMPLQANHLQAKIRGSDVQDGVLQ